MIKTYNDDFLKIASSIQNESVDLLVTDPPYKVTSRGNFGSTGGMLKTKLSLKGKIFEKNNISFNDWIPEVYRILKDGSHAYIMCNHVNLIELLNVATNTGFKFIKSLIWNKGNKICGTYYMPQFEYILFFRKGKGIKVNNCSISDILEIPNIKTKINGQNIHDTEKPVELMKILISQSSKKGQIILDPFMGSGSTGVACKELERDFIGIELDEKYFKIAYDRINNISKSKVENEDSQW